MTDLILDALNANQLNKENISFSTIRQIAGRNCDVWGQLGRGRSILSSEDQLDQYLYSYGPMIQSQWDFVLANLNFPESSVQLIDYACGQGLASVFLHDQYQDSELARIENINLIEPSSVALKRASAILECCYPNASINGVKKLLDDVEENEIFLSDESVKVHLFSNILDIEGFDQYKLLNKVLSKSGEHWLIAVSHDRDHNGGSERLRHTYETLLDDDYKDWYRVIESNIEQFECQNGQPAIAFVIKLEI